MAILAILLIAPSLTVQGQTTFGSITGNVTDPSGAAVPNVAIEVTHLRSNYKYTIVSNEAGTYTVAQLLEGEYTLRATASGFRTFNAQNIVLAAREQRRVDIQLQVGAVDAQVEVTAGATLIETETARIGDSKNADALKNLPLNSRSLYSFLALTPGVLAAGGGQATRRFAGSRVNQSEQSIDGISVSNGFDGTQISPLVDYIESFAEVRVDMANNSADIGSVGQVTVISKSGGNEIHGSAFDYYSTPWFRARHPFAAQRPGGVRHQPGGSIGGPIVIPKVYDGHDRSFFFFSFETSRGSSIQQLLNPSVPLAAWRAGDFSAITTPIRNPFNNNQPFAGNRIPDNLINPVARRIQERFFPLPNFGNTAVFAANNYREQKSRAFDPSTYYTTRLDHRFSGNSFIFGRWTWNRQYGRAFEGNLPTIGQLWNTRDTRAMNISHTHNIRPNLISETRWGFAYNDNPRHGAQVGKEIVQSLGLVGLADNLPDIQGLTTVTFQNLGLTGLSQTPWRHPGFKNFAQQWQQHVNWYKGRHSIKAGGILSRVRFEDVNADAALFGSLTFSNRFTGHTYADFLLGIPTTAARAFAPVPINRLRWAYDFFVADDFKITPKLTINIGARYELHPSYVAENGLQSRFDLASGRIIVPKGSLNKVSPLLPRSYVDVTEASGQRLINVDKNNFAPRVGLAYRPWGADTVLRAGFGVFYDVVSRPEGTGVPFAISEPAFTNPTTNPSVILPRVFPTTSSGPTTIGIPTAINPNLQTPYSMQYNLTLEHQRWNTGFRLSYIGTNTRQGEYTFNINQPVADNRLFVDKPRRFPNYPNVGYLTNGAGHQYHSMTVEVERRNLNGFSYQGSWVWARDIGDLDRAAAPENAFNRERERGVWLDIPTHRVTGNLVYELPFGNGKRWFNNHAATRAIFGGWSLSGIYSHHSGQFLTPLWTGPDPTGTAFTANRTPANVTIRPNILRDPNLPSSQRAVTRWFDVSAFGPPTTGSFGTASRGAIKGPTANVVHGGVMKNFSFKERLRLRFEMTGTNLFNHPNYSVLAGNALNISQTAAVGVLTGVGDTSSLDQSGARSFRAGIRLEW